MKNNKGFIISTILYSAFGIMMITVASIFFVLSSKTATMTTMTDKLKICIEECNTPENMCDGVCDEVVNPTLSSLILGEQVDGVYNTSEQQSRGLYKSTATNNGKETYYFKGNGKMNNYVVFGTIPENVFSDVIIYNENDYGEIFFDKMLVSKKGEPILWRVVRVNEDGSIRLITEHNIASEIAPGSINYRGSNLETVLNDWYTKAISDDSKVIIGVFCNDTTNSSTTKELLTYQDSYGMNYGITSGDTDFSDATYRVFNNKPSFKCPSSGIVEAKVGTITADELAFSGLWYSESSSYLNNGTRFWTMTTSELSKINDYKYPMLFSAESTIYGRTGIVKGTFRSRVGNYSDGYINSPSYAVDVRAVINLSPDVTVSYGTSLSEYNPYVIE